MVGSDTIRLRERLRDKTPRVAILGMGPSAAYAYRACKTVGVTPVVYGQPSPQPKGAFWLHWMPPQVDMADDPIKVTPRGTNDEYTFKQWGKRGLNSSFPLHETIVSGYEPASGLAKLWEGVEAETTYQGKLTDEAIVLIARQFDVVLQTFPRKVVLGDDTTQIRIPIIWKKYKWARPKTTLVANHVVYNGVPGNIVRSSWLWGIESHECLASTDPGYFNSWLDEGYGVEWRVDLHPDVKEGFARPIAENVHFLGRYARQARKELSYEAYGRTLEVLKEWA